MKKKGLVVISKGNLDYRTAAGRGCCDAGPFMGP